MVTVGDRDRVRISVSIRIRVWVRGYLYEWDAMTIIGFQLVEDIRIHLN